MKYTASGFLEHDPRACREDVLRLGLDGAAEYALGIAHGDEEERWDRTTLEEMRSAIEWTCDGYFVCLDDRWDPEGKSIYTIESFRDMVDDCFGVGVTDSYASEILTPLVKVR